MADKALERRLKFLIASLRRHGARHVFEVFRQARIRARYRAGAPHEPIAVDALMHSFSWFDSSDSFLDDYHRSIAPRLPFTLANRKEFFTSLLTSIEGYDQLLQHAEAIAEGRFPMLGICTAQSDGDYEWHRDALSGRLWPADRFDAIDFMSGAGSDVKYVWELNRMYWISWLGNAYWITSNGAWARDFTRLIGDWTASNPLDVGVNWSMPMEVAIRAFWLAMGYAYFAGAPGIDEQWWIDYLRTLHEHGRYLECNLEYFSNLTNHYLSNCLGLIAVGTMFADTADGARWFAEGRRRLIAELEHQVLPDGVHYERSIEYHRLVLEMFLTSAVLCRRGGAPLPEWALARIERMAEFTCDCIPPHGDVPQFGDSDDGVLLRMTPTQDLYDHRDTLALAASLFDRADMAAVAGHYSLAAAMLLGAEGFERFRALSGRPPGASRLYADGGFAVLRSTSLHVVADVGPIGLHGNNDVLSFTLHGPAGAYIVDPGTYCYTRDAARRNELRSSRAHNGPVVDNREVAEFDGLWRVRSDRTRPRVTEFADTTLMAEHRAYGRAVSRRWELDGAVLRVTDDAGKCTVRFTIPGEVTVVRRSDRSVELACGASRLLIESTLDIAILDGWYSPSYGVGAPATWLELAGESGRHRFTHLA